MRTSLRSSLAAAVAAAWGLSAQAIEYRQIVPEKSTVQFVSKQMNVPVEGRFNRFDAQLRFDPAKVDAAKLSFTVDIASIDAGSKDANAEVVAKPWFNTAAFPQASFVAETFKTAGPNRFDVAGKLTLKGRTLPLTVTVSHRADGALGIFEGSFVLKRTDFGIGEGPWADGSIVATDVQVRIHLTARAS